jgi:hypothetical protein
MKSILLFVIIIGVSCNAFAQIDTIFVEEYDTIIVTKEPVIVNSQYVITRIPVEKKYLGLFYMSVGPVLNNIKVCDHYSVQPIKDARQYEYFFSFNALVEKKNNKRFSFEIGLSCDYFNQNFSYPDSSQGEQKMKSNSIYLGMQSSLKYAIVRSKKKFKLAYYVGLKGLYVLSQNGSMYNIVDPYMPNNITAVTKNFNYGIISRLEATYKIGYNAAFVFGMNYYFDLKYYTDKNSDYYIHRNIPGLFVGYRFGF